MRKKAKLNKLTNRRIRKNNRKLIKYWNRKINEIIISAAKSGDTFMETRSIDKNDNAAMAIQRYAVKYRLNLTEKLGDNDMESIFRIEW